MRRFLLCRMFAVADISDDVGFERGTRKDTDFGSVVSLMGMDFYLPIKH